MSGTNGGYPSDFTARRLEVADILARVARTPAHRQAVDRLRTADLRIDDQDALDDMQDAPELTPRERRVVARAIKVSLFGPTAPPKRPPDPAEEKANAEALGEEAEALVKKQAAMDERLILSAQLRRVTSEGEGERLAAKLREAEEAYRLTDEAYCRAARVTMKLERQRLARDRAFAVQHT